MAFLNEEKLGWQDKLDKFDSMQHELHAAERQFDAWTNVKNLSRAKKLGTASRGEEESKNRREEDWMLLSQQVNMSHYHHSIPSTIPSLSTPSL